MKRLVFAALVTALLLFPLQTHAEGLPPRQPRLIDTKSLPHNVQILTLEDEYGEAHIFVTHTTMQDGGVKLTFWHAANQAQAVLFAGAIAQPHAFRRLPAGSWIWWNGDDFGTIYVSHALIVDVKHAILASMILAGLCALVPDLTPSAALWVAIAQSGRNELTRLDELRDPGFWIYYWTKPRFSYWIRP